MEKVIRDGKVAVLLSGGWGAGWGSWNYGDHNILMFHPKLVQMVEEGRHEEITEKWLKSELGLKNVFLGGVEGLYIKWVPEGTRFRIDEYDGAETIITEEDLNMVA